MKSKIALGLYSAASYLVTPFALARLAIKSASNAGYREYIGERFGFVPRSGPGQYRLHFHAVSVGETLVAAPMIRQMSKVHPDWSFSVSVTTPTGREQANKHLAEIADISFLPFDLPDAVNRFLTRIKPDLLVMVETELWPNLTNQCNRRSIPTILMNGRMSEKSAARYRKISSVTRPMMAQLDLILAQFDTDAKRFVELGCAPDKVLCAGNLKFDIQLTDALRYSAANLKEQLDLKNRLVWIAASTHPGEDALLLDTHLKLLKLYPELILILVPRHPERRKELQQLAAERGLSNTLRSQDSDQKLASQVFIVDTLGELNLFYGVSDIAFVGGSMVSHGGHNPIEPALWGLPILTGVHCHNFSEITRQMAQAESLIQCENIDQLFQELRNLLQDRATRENMGNRARQVLASNQGALDTQQKQIEDLVYRNKS